MTFAVLIKCLGRFAAVLLCTSSLLAWALDEQRITFKPVGNPQSPGAQLPTDIPAVLRLPPGDKLVAVVIVHGSGGVDGRGALMAQALNAAGIATMEIDMWTPRRVVNLATRPKSTLDTLPDVYGALAYLNSHPRIDRGRVGITGFSWGGVLALATAFGAVPSGVPGLPNGGFRAHAPFYPSCEVWLPGGSAERLISLHSPTGAPVLLHNGTRDDYDSSSDVCARLPAAHPKMPLEVVMVSEATHGFDGEQAYPPFYDPRAKGGKGSEVRMLPNPVEGARARERVAVFFKQHLSQ